MLVAPNNCAKQSAPIFALNKFWLISLVPKWPNRSWVGSVRTFISMFCVLCVRDECISALCCSSKIVRVFALSPLPVRWCCCCNRVYKAGVCESEGMIRGGGGGTRRCCPRTTPPRNSTQVQCTRAQVHSLTLQRDAHSATDK